MKSAWNILQAAGYARNSRVWQIRNPDKIQAGQDQVFQTNVSVETWGQGPKITEYPSSIII